jgi:hypothetical protein
MLYIMRDCTSYHTISTTWRPQISRRSDDEKSESKARLRLPEADKQGVRDGRDTLSNLLKEGREKSWTGR